MLAGKLFWYNLTRMPLILSAVTIFASVLLTPAASAARASNAPREVKLADLDESYSNGCTIVTTGTVTELGDDEIDTKYRRFVLRDGDKTIPTFVHTGQTRLPPDLNERRIQMTGIYQIRTGGARRFGDPYLVARSITVLDDSVEDPFAAPTLDTTPYQTPKDLARMGRRTASGQVLASWNNTRIMLRTGKHSVILVFCSDGATPPPCGSTITASGFPTTDRFHLILNRATIRIDDQSTPQEETVRPTLATEIVSHRNGRVRVNLHLHSVLISLTGIVRSLPAPESPRRLAHVECQGVDVPVDFSAAPNAFARAQIGCTVRLTGRCLITAEDWSPFDPYPQLGQATLLLRKTDDVVVLSRPPWWTPGRLLVIIGILLAVIIAFIIRSHLQKQMERLKLSERTRLAVDLHDSLSQALAGLACQIAATGEDLKNNLPSVKDKLASADRMLKSCRTELKNCLFDLRNDTLDEKDLTRAVRRTIENLLPYASISIRFNVKRSLLDDSTVHALLAIIRELVANAIRHGAADSIRIAGSIEKDRLLFSVSDDGLGFDPQTCRGINEGHFGLNGIRERVSTLKGTVEIDSRPGNGTYVKISLPVNAK